MSAYSTVYISRNKALSIIHANVGNLSDQQLSDMVDIFLEPSLRRADVGYNDEHDNEVAI